MSKTRIVFAVAVLLVGMLALSLTAQATPLVPGATVVPSAAATFGTAGGETLVTSSVGAGTTFGGVTGFWWAAVYRGGTSALCPTCLSFYYQVRNDGTTIVNRETNFNFDAFATDVQTAAGGFDIFVAGTQAPNTADREASGGTVGFNFGAEGSGLLDPGEVSTVLIIRTNATNFGTGFSSIIDGGTSNRQTFAPAAVPEPASLFLLGTGLVGMAAMFRRRK